MLVSACDLGYEELEKLQHCPGISKLSLYKHFPPAVLLVAESARIVHKQRASNAVFVPLPDLRDPILEPLLLSEIRVPHFGFIELLHRINLDVSREQSAS